MSKLILPSAGWKELALIPQGGWDMSSIDMSFDAGNYSQYLIRASLALVGSTAVDTSTAFLSFAPTPITGNSIVRAGAGNTNTTITSTTEYRLGNIARLVNPSWRYFSMFNIWIWRTNIGSDSQLRIQHESSGYRYNGTGYLGNRGYGYFYTNGVWDTITLDSGSTDKWQLVNKFKLYGLAERGLED